MSAPQVSATGSRSRPQARKKVNDDAAYFGPQTTAGAKRHAADKADGEPRVKRKRVDALATASRREADPDSKVSLVEFIKMPTPVLYRYLSQFDLIPEVHPSPGLANDPPPPAVLDQPQRQPSRGPSPPALTTPANRPRRESKDQTRRRSSRFEEETPSRAPIFADIDDLHGVLAGIAERHFREMAINGRDVDILAVFMSSVEKAKGGKR
ncbi:hypothetical protein FB45DRAFT_915399 [Roridomyces roridus]|uniref:Histone deacetylase complex subunit SAP30 Sin3 binding domain-containing protein n=1 Tax=Roridomyces roridus TaxID=1738132 RepID=A0AAD7FP72_9AGAR|nr:hypothetical protein FB45DRAFT_915399 [Roridomyces roridus]